MVPVVDVARVLVSRLNVKRVVATRNRWEAGVGSRTPLPLHGYTGYRGTEDTAPGRRNTAPRQTRRQRESQTGKEDFIAA
jgi:hypothetical protein